MKDLEQLKQLILADLEKESKQRIEVATKEQEERINQNECTIFATRNGEENCIKTRSKITIRKRATDYFERK